jgi:hypothetical protein
MPPLDPMITASLALVLTAFAGWIRGRTVGRREGESHRPPPRCKICEARAEYCAHHSDPPLPPGVKPGPRRK